MRILGLLFVMPVIFVFGCTTDQHIRKDNYYSYDWSVLGAVSNQTRDAIKHHPLFATTQGSAEGTPTYEQNINYFLFGALPLIPEVKLSEACGEKPFRQAYADHNFLQALVSVLTLGIYTPRRIRVWCGHESASN